MKIAFLTERMILGFGVDLVINNIANGLSKLGNEVTVFAINIDGSYKNLNYKIKQIPCPLIWNPIKQELVAHKFLPYIKNLENEFDIFIIETFPFFQYAAFLNKPIVVVEYGVPSTMGMNWKTRIRLGYEKFTKNFIYYRFTDKIIPISNYLKSTLPLYAKKKADVIYCGSDHYFLNIGKDQDKKVETLKMKLNIKKDDKVLLYVGRLNYADQPYKGVDDLLRIFKKIKKYNSNVQLLMVGYGNEIDREYLEKLGAKVIVKAPIEEMPTIFSACDICVSASKWEGFDLPIAEANSFGKPSVCYNLGPHPEVIKNGISGFVVKDNDEFVEKVLDLVKNESLYKKLSIGATTSSKKFIWENIINQYNEILKKTMQDSKKNKVSNYKDGLVDVITLNYNGKKYLDQLFNSLEKQTYKKIKITMVDNGSKDDSVEYVKKNYKKINLIVSKTNLFFPKGNNLAIGQTNGEYILFVNNDIIVDQNAIEEMVKVIKKDEKIAAVVPKMMFFKNPKVFDSFGVAIMKDGSPFNIGIGQYDIGQYDVEKAVFGACFGAVLIKRSVYENSVGPLDNDYFGYFEDVDWNFRANGMGYKFVTCPNAIFYHDHSGTAKSMGNEWKYFLIHRNFLRTLFKNYGNKHLLKYFSYRLLGYVKQAIKPPFKERRITSIKIIANTIAYLPKLILKRLEVKKNRIDSITDDQIWSFADGEQQFFDSENYEILYSLENIRFSYDKKYKNLHLLEVSHKKKIETMETLSKLNELFFNNKLYSKNKINNLVKSIEKDLIRDLGEKDGKLCAKKIAESLS